MTWPTHGWHLFSYFVSFVSCREEAPLPEWTAKTFLLLHVYYVSKLNGRPDTEQRIMFTLIHTHTHDSHTSPLAHKQPLDTNRALGRFLVYITDIGFDVKTKVYLTAIGATPNIQLYRLFLSGKLFYILNGVYRWIPREREGKRHHEGGVLSTWPGDKITLELHATGRSFAFFLPTCLHVKWMNVLESTVQTEQWHVLQLLISGFFKLVAKGLRWCLFLPESIWCICVWCWIYAIH